jgi:hypothetical protein
LAIGYSFASRRKSVSQMPPRTPNMPRPHQYRVGSIVRLDNKLYQIMQIEKLKKAPMTYAVTYWTLGTNDYWESEPHQKIWNGAHMLNDMLDAGEAIVESY